MEMDPSPTRSSIPEKALVFANPRAGGNTRRRESKAMLNTKSEVRRQKAK
jgi:hypothetical protein